MNRSIIKIGYYCESCHNASVVVGGNGIYPTVMENHGTIPAVVIPGEGGVFQIRKLTPREFFHLMGVNDENIDHIQEAGISSSQQRKLAGNSIVVDVLEHIFNKLFIDKENTERQLSLF